MRFSRDRSSTTPSSLLPNPARLWPPLRIANGRSCSRAKATERITSMESMARTMSAGERTNALFQTRRAASYSASSGVMSGPRRPWRRASMPRASTCIACSFEKHDPPSIRPEACRWRRHQAVLRALFDGARAGRTGP